MSCLDLGPGPYRHWEADVAVHAATMSGLSAEAYVQTRLRSPYHWSEPTPSTHEPMDVVVYGFGRIGRLATQACWLRKPVGARIWCLRAVVLRPPKDPILDLNRRASLLRRDSIHGGFKGTIRVDEENHVLVCNGNAIRFIYASDPASIDYTQYGINNALVIDSSGVWRDESGPVATPAESRASPRSC